MRWGKRDKPDPAVWRLVVQIVSYHRHYFKMVLVFRNRRQMQLSLTEPIFHREVQKPWFVGYYWCLRLWKHTQKKFDLTFISPTENLWLCDVRVKTDMIWAAVDWFWSMLYYCNHAILFQHCNDQDLWMEKKLVYVLRISFKGLKIFFKFIARTGLRNQKQKTLFLLLPSSIYTYFNPT